MPDLRVLCGRNLATGRVSVSNVSPLMRSALALALALLAVPAAAGAATRYVSPGGAAEGACARSSPCSVAWAINGGGSAPGDTVVIGRGTYVDQPVVVGRELTITAAPDRPRPVFRMTTPGGVALTVGPGAEGALVERLAIQATGTGARAVVVDDAATLSDLRITSAAAPCLLSAARGVRIEASSLTLTGVADAPCLETTGSDTIWNDIAVSALNAEVAALYSGNATIDEGTFNAQGTGLMLSGSPEVHRVTAAGGERGIALTGTVRLTDSVAIARRGGSGVFAGSGSHQLLNVTAWAEGAGAVGIRAATGGEMSVKNTIARGIEYDMSAEVASPAIDEDCAVFTGCPAGKITVGNSNFRSGAWVQDAGANQSEPPRFADAGFEDFRLRKGSPAIDTGSFEFNSSSADRDGRFRWLGYRPDMGAYEYPSPRPPTPRADRKAPSLGVVRLTAARFRAATGTTLIFVVSEDSDLVAQVWRPGQRRSVATLVRPAGRGTNRIRIRGPIDGRTIAPGRYVLTVIARDVSQNLSRPRRLLFTVVR